MAVQHDPDRSFIHGLGDFWTAYFQDTSLLEAHFAAGQVMIGQIYLDLLQEVLGTSLDHAPLFSKRYYKLFLVREDQLRFVEGASAEDDRFFFAPPEAVVTAPTLINKVVAPSSYLFANADYEVRFGGVLFKRNPFDVNGEVQPGFAARTTQVTTPVVQTSLLGTSWVTAGVLGGDTLQYVVQSSPAIETEIRLARGTNLVLTDDRPEFRADLRGRSTRFRVLRAPYNAEQIGVEVGGPLSFSAVPSATLVPGTVTVNAATASTAWIGGYLYVDDAGHPTNSGLYRVNSAVNGVSVTLARTANFVATTGPLTVTRVRYGTAVSGGTPRTLLPHTFLTRGTLSVNGRRALAREVDGVLYPVGGELVEGVDFAVDYDGGTLTALSVWDPAAVTRLSYRWRLLVAEEAYRLRDDLPGAIWDPAEPYALGDVVNKDGFFWAAKVQSPQTGTFHLSEWAPYAPFRFDDATDVREVAYWAPDVLVDEQRLYTNFGYLLGYNRPSSEQYRAFLKGVAQLFLLGPSLARMRSALNVVAGLPVVRDEGEVLRGYQSGYEPLGNTLALTGNDEVGDGGAVIDYAEGEDGTLDGVAGTFSSPTLNLIPGTDVGVVLRLRYDNQFADYVVTSVSPNGLSAKVSPPPVSFGPLRWSYRHNAANGQFRVESSAVHYAFSESDVDSVITIERTQGANWVSGTAYGYRAIVFFQSGSYECVTPNSDVTFTPANWRRLPVLPDRNVGTFRIVGVDGPRAVRLDSPYGFTDMRGLRWRLSHSQVQRVETDKNTYTLPLGIPLRDEVTDNSGYVFRAYDTLSSVIGVVDYIVDPTWWHRVAIPQELLQLEQDAPGRRQVTPELIQNVIGPVDQAVIGDPGVFFGADDAGEPGYDRVGPALWLGGPWVELNFPAGMKRATSADIGQSLTFEAGPFEGSYAVVGVGPGDSVKLDRFPPPEARHLTPALPVARVRLPSLVYRRTVAFVMVDRFLKYHAIHAEVEVLPGLPLGFLSDAAGLLNTGKPGYTYVFVESSTGFVDNFRFTESFTPDIGHPFYEQIRDTDNHLAIDGSVAMGEFYKFFNGHVSGTSVGGAVSFTVTPSLPYTPDRSFYIFGKFTQGNTQGYALALGQDYTFDYATGACTVPAMDAGPYRFDFVLVALRVHSPVPSPWWSGVYPGETPVVIGGANPTLRRRAGTTVREEGMMERAIEITIATP